MAIRRRLSSGRRRTPNASLRPTPRSAPQRRRPSNGASFSSCTQAESTARTRQPQAWNVDDHKRKFLRLPGEACLTSDPSLPPLRVELAFWGEWEPESEAQDSRLPLPEIPIGSTGRISSRRRRSVEKGKFCRTRIRSSTAIDSSTPSVASGSGRRYQTAHGTPRSRRRLADPLRLDKDGGSFSTRFSSSAPACSTTRGRGRG